MYKPILSIETKDKSLHPIIQKNIHKYNTFQLTPDRFIESGKIIEEVLTTITALDNINGLKFENKSIILDKFQPIYYEIYVTSSNISFNYIIPDDYTKILSNKIKNIFKTATFQQKEDYFSTDFNNVYYCNYNLTRHYMFSINSDYRENGLIEAFLGISNNILDDDKLLFQIGIKPANEAMWKQEWESAHKKFKEGDKLQINHSILTAILDGIFNITDSLFKVFDIFIGTKIEKELNKYNLDHWERKKLMLSHASQMKRTYNGYHTQFRLFCNNKANAYYYFKMINGVLKLLDGDNEIISTNIKLNKSTSRNFSSIMNKNILCQKELSHFLQMPNRRMQVEYKNILTSVETRETEIPKQLLDKRGIIIGDYTYKGEHYTTYFPNDKHNSNYSLLITGFQRVGKTTALARIAVDSTIKGHSSFIIDTIQGCDLSNRIRDYMPQKYADKIIILDYSNLEFLIPLAWNEVNLDDRDNKTKMMKASMLAGSFEAFLETCANRIEEYLSPKMSKHLASACKVVMSQQNTNINDIIQCLCDYRRRHELIDSCSLNKNSITIQDLLVLDTQDKQGNYGTDYREIVGIMDRISVLTNDYLMEMMLSVSTNTDINFRYWADNGYCILLKIPESVFSSISTNTLVTFLFSKIWLSILNRKPEDIDKLPPVHILADEIHKFPQVNKLLTKWIRESAKYKTNFIISAHSLIDLKSLLPVFGASGANYMIFKSSAQNYKLLEKEIYPYEIDELMQLKPFHALNIVNYSHGEYAQFITQLPPPIDKEFPKVDRSKLDKEFSERFGRKYED